MIEYVVDFQPNHGFPTDEPSLRDLIFRYYHSHFPYAEALEWADKYIELIEAEYYQQRAWTE